MGVLEEGRWAEACAARPVVHAGALVALVKRLEYGKEPDRSVDHALCYVYGGFTSLGAPAMVEPEYWDALSGGTSNSWVPAYTASLADTLTLTERLIGERHPGWTYTLRGIYSKGHAELATAEITWPSNERQGRHRLAASALCVALLRALIDP